jgi:hypothetical protein
VIPLESEPGFPKETEVEIGGTKVPQVMDCATENGWVYTNPMGRTTRSSCAARPAPTSSCPARPT